MLEQRLAFMFDECETCTQDDDGQHSKSFAINNTNSGRPHLHDLGGIVGNEADKKGRDVDLAREVRYHLSRL